MIYFTTTEWLKDNLPLNKNTDVNLITPLVKSSADMYTRNILGTYFYNDLLTKYNAQTLSPDEITLVSDYVKYAIGWKALSELAVTSAYELTNKGPQTQSGDFSTNTEYKAVMFLVRHYADKADFYLNRLSEYLIKNKNLYTGFTSDLNVDSSAKCSITKGNNFTNNILFI